MITIKSCLSCLAFRLIFRHAFWLALCLALESASSYAAEVAPGTLCVMSYNLRYASTNPPNAWPQRRPLMRECILKVNPDVIGTQEGLYGQLKEIATDLPEYEWLGLGRDGGSKGEFMAIFYRKSRLEPMAFDHFWLSDTPELVGSSTWGNSNRRMVTWIRFSDRQSGQQFYMVNTHFDHEIQVAREKSAVLLKDRVQRLAPALPVIVTGDFNATSANKAHDILLEGGFFFDTWNAAKERRGEGLGTFNNFKEVYKSNNRIDWILARGKVAVDAEEIVTFSRDGQFPSDHCPLVAWIRLEKE